MKAGVRKVQTPIYFARRLEKIPAKFLRAQKGKPFQKCSICSQDLAEPTLNYMINKYYVGGEMKREMAVCSECQARLQAEYSPESTAYLQSLLNRIDQPARHRLVFSNYTDRVERMTAYCILCRSSRFAVEAYFEYAECQANRLLISLHPTLVCGDCAQDIYEGLSAETRDSRRRFFEPFLGLPPVPGKEFGPINGSFLKMGGM